MKVNILQVSHSKKLENAIFISVLLFIYKIVFPINETITLLIINEILILLSVFAWVNYVSEFINPKLSKPISLIINTGILNALVFFIISISSWLFLEAAKFYYKLKCYLCFVFDNNCFCIYWFASLYILSL